MGKRVLDTSCISTTRLTLLHKGYLNINDIAKFVPCGRANASKIFDSIRSKVKSEGLENCSDVILVKRMLEYLGKTVSDIEREAKQELAQKKDA